MKTNKQLGVGILILGVLTSTPALANGLFGDCIAPDKITVPVSLKSETDAAQWLSNVQTAELTHAEYLRCLNDYGTAHKDTLTDSERADLINEIETSVAAVKQLASDWNNVFGRFQDDQNKKAF